MSHLVVAPRAPSFNVFYDQREEAGDLITTTTCTLGIVKESRVQDNIQESTIIGRLG